MAKFPKSFGPDVEVEDVDLNETEVYSGGERLTEERAEAIADVFEAKARSRANLIPGGKSLSGEGKKSPVVQFRVPEGLRALLDERAEEEGVTPSRLARKALEKYLNDSATAGRA